MKNVKLEVMDIKVSQEWDEDVGGLVATIKMKAKVGTDDIMKLAYLQSVPPPIQCELSTTQESMRLMVDKETGEVKA